MTISFVIQDLFGCGAQYVTATIARGFVAKGYTVELVLSALHRRLAASGRTDTFELPEGVKIVYLPYERASRNVLSLRRYLTTTRSKVVIAMQSTYAQALAIASLGLRRRPKLLMVEHNSNVGVTFNTGEEVPAPGLLSLKRAEYFLVKHAFDRFAAVSEGVRRALIRLYRSQSSFVGLVYNPVVDDVFRRKVQLPPSHPWLRNRLVPTFVVAGAHTGFKHQLLAIQACEIANRTRPCRLIVFGRGELTGLYEQYIAEHKLSEIVSLPGFTTVLPAEIRASSGFVLSSSSESFSVVLVEALAAGVPVIATDCPYGPREILAGGLYGRLVENGNVEGLAAAMLAACDGKVPVAPAEAWQRFSLERIVARYEEQFRLMGVEK